MQNKKKLALVAIAAATITAGCNSFLTGDKLSNNPNQPTAATASQLFIGVSVSIMAQWEAFPLNLLPTWVDQIAGVNRQWHDFALYQSGTDNLTTDPTWIGFYGPGGLADIRRGENEATTDGNTKAVGQFRVLEALYMGTTADLFGAAPWDNALTPFPTFDSQARNYEHAQAELDSAITDLGGTGAGNAVDFFYGNDFDKWIRLAHTLKARFYMHTAENPDLSYNNTILGQVLTETAAGISGPSGDFDTQHTESSFEANLFYEFLVGSRKGDVEPSALHINLLQTLNDPDLLTFLYGNAPYLGSAPGASGGSGVSNFAIGPTLQMQIVSYSENILLSAEANYRLGNLVPAATQLQLEHSAYGEPGTIPVGSGTNALLIAILSEKYARAFLNPEVYFDYLRTCVPNIPLPAGHSANFPYVPARFDYGYTEETTNLENTPEDPIANGNWPKHATSPSGAACAGQKDRPGV
jgi:hypothetical protein